LSPQAGWRRVAAFPDLLSLHADAPDSFPFLLESAVPGAGPRPATARYDLLLGDPGPALTLEADGGLWLDDEPLPGTDFLGALTRWRLERAPRPPAGFPGPFWGGFFLYFAYELSAHLEDLPPAKGRLSGPVAQAVACDAGVIRDHVSGEALVAACGAGAETRVAELAEWVAAAGPAPEPGTGTAGRLQESDPAPYLEGVRRARDYIHAGDVFQVNLARPWTAELNNPDPVDLYARLRRANPAPFAGLARLPRGPAIVSSSPERLLRARDGTIETRPIAGTRPRGSGGADDRRLQDELRAHPKERAEHVMLIDLERNDLGKVSRPGTVSVDELMVLESYAHVHHITSNVCGELASGIEPERAIGALFPGGTITGCPKVRCMEIIHELEQQPRGAYTGAMGYLCYDGNLDLNILIRTLAQQGTFAAFLTGAGVVADSDPQSELAETRAKARGLAKAIQPQDS
jgi:anthranilate synthase component 1